MDPDQVKAYGVRVRRSGARPTDDEVAVAYNFPRAASGTFHPLLVRSSNAVRGGLPVEFGDKVRAVVRRRRQAGGASKGRVLYVMQGKCPLALLAYHVPDRGPLEIIAVGASRAVLEPDAVRFQAHLIACLEEAALMLERGDRLAWAASTENAAAAATSVFGFRRAKRPEHSTAKHYLTRAITPRTPPKR